MKEFTKLIFEHVANKKLDSKTAKSIINSYQAQLDKTDNEQNSKDIAVIGMACNFGGAVNLKEFWSNLEQGRDCLTEVPKDRWKEEHWYSRNIEDTLRSYSKWGSFVSHAKDFDTEFFNQSENSAIVTDPQQRLFLHLCWEALEHAGYGSESSRKYNMGVFVGARGNVYNSESFINDIDTISMSRKERIELFRSVLLGKAPNMIAAAVSNFLNLKGPSLVVDTACSSSLVSIHLACQSILNGDCEMAIAGGIEVLADENTYIYLSQIKALSPDGKCKTFDKNANGYVPGEGGGAVILKRLDKARKDRDNILAVIKGSAVNNDGYTVGTTTPDVEGQKEVLKKAYKKAGVDPKTVTLIEAHGTGTFLGDPTEFRALTEVFKENTKSLNFCALGTVKSNIGHLHSAAGIASFIKIVLALSKEKIPATLNCKEPNPRFDLVTSPFYIADHTTDWIITEGERRAGISSFGFGGTNCHIILEEVQKIVVSESTSSVKNYLAVYSAKNKEALKKILENHVEFLERYTGTPEDYTYSLNTGREIFDSCIAITFSELKELKQNLADRIQDFDIPSMIERRGKDFGDLPKAVMIFPGQGSQYNGMAKELYHHCASFREAFDQCEAITSKYLGKSIKTMIFTKDADDCMNETQFTQPIVFAIDYSIGKMWLNLGITPSAVLGHSIGEYAAACIAGVFQLEDAIRLVVKRAALMNDIDCKGGMMVVFADEDTVKRISDNAFYETDKKIYIGAVNGPANTVIAGTKAALHLIKQKFQEAGVGTKDLAVSHPFHSELMMPMLKEYEYELSSIKMSRAQIPLVCNVTGDFKYDFNVDYWLSHIIKPVKFYQSVQSLLKKDYDCFVEAGPGTTITTMLKRIEEIGDKPCISTIKSYKSNWKSLIEAVAVLEKMGFRIHFNELYKRNQRQKIELPNYPFQYRSYWIDQEKASRVVKEIKGTIRNKNQGCLSYALFDTIQLISDNELQLEKAVKPGELKVIRDHIVENQVIMPGVCFWEMAQIAALYGYGKVPVTLNTITYPYPLVIEKETETKYRLNLDKQSGKFKVSFLSKTERDTEKDWVIAAIGTIETLNAAEKNKLDISAIKNRLYPKHLEGSILKKQFSDKGLTYGNEFYSVIKIWEGNNEALAELEFKANNKSERYMYHPGILDGALQTIAGVEELAQDFRKYIPYRVKKVEFYGLLEGNSYGYVKLTRYNKDKGLIEFQVLIADIYGNVKVFIEDMCLKAVYENPKKEESNRNQENLEYYMPYWQELNISLRPIEERGHVLLFQEGRKETFISAMLEKNGYGISKVCKEESYGYGITQDNYFVVSPHKKDSYEALFRELKKEKTIIDSIVLDYTDNEEGVNKTVHSVESSIRQKVMELVYIINGLRNYYLNQVHIRVITRQAFILNDSDTGVNYWLSALTGFSRCISLEYKNISCMFVDIENDTDNVENTELSMERLLRGYSEGIFAIRNGSIYSQGFKKEGFIKNAFHKLPFREGGVYIIAGGLGGIGEEIAKCIGKSVKAKLILLGRSPLPEREQWDFRSYKHDSKTAKKIKGIKDIEALGCEVLYRSVDIGKEEEVMAVLADVREIYGTVNGVIHAAGILKDGLIKSLEQKSYDEVAASKIRGAWLLDQATNGDKLDFFVLCSAMVTYLGNVGQSSYSTANAFLDSFAAYRTRIKKKRTIVINWGVWSEVGMVADSLNKKRLKEKGVLPLTTNEALKAFCNCLTQDKFQFGIGKFDDIVEKKLLSSPDMMSRKPKGRITLPKQEVLHYENETDLETKVKEYLLNKVNSLKDTNKSINYKTSFLDAGLDSMTMVNFTDDFLRETGIELYPTVLFEYPTIQELTKYLLKDCKQEIETFFKATLTSNKEIANTVSKISEDRKKEIESLHTSIAPTMDTNREYRDSDIAVIGMSGIFPGAENVWEYWDNLLKGRNCVVEVPKERWDYKEYYQQEKKKGKTYCKWGGFVDGIDLFDPLFFNLSPMEATVLDPQQKFLLQAGWEALEDAGYANGTLFHTNTGVFIGVSNHNYFDESFDANNNYSGLGTANAIVANRLSYFLDLKGPSMSIDTQCSSSLVAVHEACKSILAGECGYALAGGVNFLIPKDYYILLSQMEAVSKDGSCKTFDQEANGFISGEGIGVLVLKRLTDAIRDRDNIHCIIKASEVNHDGRSASLTAPNSKSQTELIKRCIEKASINPETITYVETHGTGTAIGDPIEVKGLTDAFTEYTDKKNYCALGAVKSNIGHLESAAGMAGIIKVIMAMKHRTIPENLHFHVKNPLIDFLSSPFYVIDKPTKWQAKGHPLRAAVSSFGMGGTNAHVILEQPPELEKTDFTKKKMRYPIILSAKSEEALKGSISRLLEYLKHRMSLTLEDVSYTLSTGRYHFNYRIATGVDSIDELTGIFKEVLEKDDKELSSSQIFYNKVEGSDAISPLNVSDLSPIPVAVILPYYNKQALKQVLNAVNSGLMENKVFYKFLESYKETLHTMGIYPNYYFNGNALLYSETETVLCIHIFTICLCRLLKVTGIVIDKIIALEHGDEVLKVLNNQKTLSEGISYVLEHVRINEPKKDNENIAAFLEKYSNEYILNLNPELAENRTESAWCINNFFSIYTENEEGIKGIIRMLSYLYVKGEAVQFNALYSNTARKISLPAYPFQVKSYWHKKNQVKTQHKDTVAEYQPAKRYKAEDYFYKWYWQKVTSNEPSILKEGAVWILFATTGYYQELIKECLIERKQRVILVYKDRYYHKKSNYEYCINPDRIEDYTAIFRDVIESFKRLDSIINLLNYEKETSDTYHGNITGLLGMALGLSQSIRDNKEINLLSITHNGLPVEGMNDNFYVSGYPVHVLSRLITDEIKNISARSIDIGDTKPSKEIFQKILFEYSLTKNGYSEVACRNNQVYVRQLMKGTVDYTHSKESVWKEGGIYVITGGASGIGAEIGLHIAKSVKATIILIGRTKLPIPDEFETYLKQGIKSAKATKITNILKIKKAGGDVTYYNTNIADEVSTLEIFQNIIKNYGHITGIFHCAGSKRDSVITAKSLEDFKEVISAKVIGLNNIKKAVWNNDVDFIMAFSSIAALYGTPGQSDYSAANALMDAYAKEWAVNTKTFVTSINWTLWEGIGMDIPLLAKRKMAGDGLRAISIQEGLNALEIILKHRKWDNYIVMDLIKPEEFLINLENNKLRTPMSLKNGSIDFITNAESKTLTSDKTMLKKETKEFLTKMLAKLLYLDVLELDTRRGLDEYGMDSLSIKEALTALEEHYNTVLEPSLFEEYPSIDALGDYLSDRFCMNPIPKQKVESELNNQVITENKNRQDIVETEYMVIEESDIEEDSPCKEETLEELYQKVYEGVIHASAAKEEVLRILKQTSET